MMKQTTSLLFLVFMAIGYAKGQSDSDFAEITLYYDSTHSVVDTKDSAAYYAVFLGKSKWTHPKSGSYKEFYMDGQLKEEGIYEEWKPSGLWTQWYENGQKKRETDYEKSTLKSDRFSETPPAHFNLYPYVESFWSRDGEPLVRLGVGRYELRDEDGKLREKGQYAEGKRVGKWVFYNKEGLVSGTEVYLAEGSVEGVSYTIENGSVTDSIAYEHIEVFARPKDGIQSFYRHVVSQVEYPKKAKKMGLTGTVYIEFIIEKDGELTNFTVTSRTLDILNEAAMKAFTGQTHYWEPAKLKGRLVRQKMTLPVKFQLQ